MTVLETETLANPADLDAKPVSSRILVLVGGIVTLVLFAMIILPALETLVRRVFHSDVPGASVYAQHLTLWTGFLGGILATATGRHLSLSTINMIPAGRPRRAAMMFSDAVTAAVTMLLAYGALGMVLKERDSNSVLAGGVPKWASELIMPIAFGVMSLRTVWRAHNGWTGRAVALGAMALMIPLYWVSPETAHKLVTPLATVIVVAFLMGAPVFVAMAGLAMLLFFGASDPVVPINAVPTSTFELVTNSTLPAVPLLTMAGYVLAGGGASQRLVRAYRALLGWMPAGLGLMVLTVCALFTSFTGASGVTILALGGVLLPSLIEEKYPEGFSLGLVTAAGSLGLLFPPSLPVILYGVVAKNANGETPDIKHLFLAGLVPGVLIIVLVFLYTLVVGVKVKAPRHPFEAKEAARALWAAKWDLGLPTLVILLFALGITTIVESAAIAALYAIIVEVIIFRNIHPTKDLPKVMAAGATLVGAVLILMGVALGLTGWLVDAQIPDALLGWVQTHLHSKWAFLLALNVLLLILGSVLEMYSAILVLAPLIAPLGDAFGVDAVHLGVVFLANLELGFLLPPMGLNLFLSATRFEKPLSQVYKHSFPFLCIMTVGVLIVTYFEGITTGVLHLLHMK